MAPLPPGRDGSPVAGIDYDANPKLARAAAALNAWVHYLLEPQTNDGPRIYRAKSGAPGDEIEVPKRDPEWEKDNGHLYDTVSVIEAYAGDPHVFVKPAQAVAGLREQTIEQAYDKLAQGCLTWTKSDVGPPPSPETEEDKEKKQQREKERITSLDYPELHPVRWAWDAMREEWEGGDNLAAVEFEKDFIRFQVYTENCLYVVAEHLARYWAIFHKGGQDIHALMNPMIEKFARPNHPIGGEEHKDGNTFDIQSILVTAVVAATVTVITTTSGGVAATAMVALGSAAIEALGEAIKTAKANGTEVTLLLNDHDRLAGTAQQYLDAVNKIEREVADAVTQLGDSLYRRLGELREERQYQVTPDDGNARSWGVPHFRDYV